MTKPAQHPQGATLPIGGDAHAHPTLEPILEPVDRVQTYPGNPRRGDQDAITSSIRDLGLYAGVIAQQSTGHVLVGNHRLRGIIALGGERVPVTWVDVDDTVAAAIVARDNLTSDRGGYDRAEQYALLQALKGEDSLALSGYLEAEYDVIRSLVDLPTDMSGPLDAEQALRDAGLDGYVSEDGAPVFQARVSFKTMGDYEEFRRLLGYTGPRRSRIWFPEQPDLIESEVETIAAGES